MVVMEKRPELNVRSGSEAELRLDRADISFHDVAGDKVRIEVTVHNDGWRRSTPTFLTIESAPFGAFVPWRPLTRLLVPALEPGESRVVRTEVARPRPAPLGNFDRVPPKRLLKAVSSPDQPSPSPGGASLLLWDLLRRARTGRASSGAIAGKASLAPDLLDLLGHGHPHWAGNINVFVGRKPVERHLARALRVYPGRTNLAMFMVGDPGRRDYFAFELVGLAPDWKAVLYDATNCRNLLVDTSEAPIQDAQWVESSGGLLVMLAAQPPVGRPAGNLEVHVTRRGDEQTAVVEFDLDPAAAGTGCYFV